MELFLEAGQRAARVRAEQADEVLGQERRKWIAEMQRALASGGVPEAVSEEVMRLVGDAIHKYGLEVPLIGVAPWGAVLGRDVLAGCKGRSVEYRAGHAGPVHIL